jgi:hypothetical protein
MVAVRRYTDDAKTCARCGNSKPLGEFSKTSKGHPHSYCRPCRNEDARQRRATGANGKHRPDYQRQKRIEDRDAAYAHYGGECQCCGEGNYLFLTLDHVNNDGKAHRDRYKGQPMYRIARREGYPDTFQLLCFNCNCGRARNGGLCPHRSTQ